MCAVSARPASGTAPLVSGALPLVGHLPEFVDNVVDLLRRGYAEHGRLFSLKLPPRRAVVLLNPTDRERFFAAPEESLSVAEAYAYLRPVFGPQFFFFVQGEERQRQRDLFLPLFRSHALEDHLAVMWDRTRALIDRLGDRGEFELVSMCAELNRQITTHAFFGAEYGRLLAGELSRLEFSIDAGVMSMPWLRPRHSWRVHRARRRLRGSVRSCIARRRREGGPPDFLTALSESRYGDGRPVPDSVAAEQALALLWAGRESTAGQLAWAVADVVSHPHCVEGLLAEQSQAGVGAGPLSFTQLQQLTLLDCVLRESERLHPLVPIIMRVAARDWETGGCRFPRGTLVMASPYLTHRLPEYFPDPEAFDPGRFRDGSGAGHHLLLFGSGAHRCVGQRFARLEIQVVLTMLLRHFHLELLDGAVPRRGLKPFSVRPPCRIRYRAR